MEDTWPNSLKRELNDVFIEGTKVHNMSINDYRIGILGWPPLEEAEEKPAQDYMRLFEE